MRGMVLNVVGYISSDSLTETSDPVFVRKNHIVVASMITFSTSSVVVYNNS